MELQTVQENCAVASRQPQSAPLRLVGVQSLRGLAVLMVVIAHLHHTELKYSLGSHLLGAWTLLGSSGVDIFLVISGFVLTYLGFGHFGTASYVKSYAFARVSRVYPVYILVTVLLVPLYLLQPALFNTTEGHQVNLWRSLLLIPDLHLPLIPVAWTLHHEIYFYLVFGAMLLLPERLLIKAMAIWLLITMALIACGQQTPRAQQGAFERVLFNPINLEFILGMVLAYAVVYGPRRGSTKCLWGALLWLCIACPVWLAVTGTYGVSDGWRVVVFGLPATLFTYGIVVREIEHGRVFWPRLAWIGDGAYSIYVTHLMVLVVMGRLWQIFGVPGMVAHLVFLAGSLGASLGLGYAIYLHVETPMLRWTKRHGPGRARPVLKRAVA